MDARDDPSWAAYAQTILVLGPAPGVTIDLRRPLTHTVREAIAQVGVRAPFAVITAFNPRGREVDEAENARRSGALAALLAAGHTDFVHAIGMSPDGVHREPGVAAELPIAEALRIAVEYEQSALFWYDGDSFWLVGALVRADPRRLPLSRM